MTRQGIEIKVEDLWRKQVHVIRSHTINDNGHVYQARSMPQIYKVAFNTLLGY